MRRVLTILALAAVLSLLGLVLRHLRCSLGLRRLQLPDPTAAATSDTPYCNDSSYQDATIANAQASLRTTISFDSRLRH